MRISHSTESAMGKWLGAIGLIFFSLTLSAAQINQTNFIEFLRQRGSGGSLVSTANTKADQIHPALKCVTSDDPLERRLIQEYGAIFAAAEALSLPNKCIYKSSDEVNRLQAGFMRRRARLAGSEIELQDAAMRALLAADGAALLNNLRLTPLDGSIAARRTYADSVRIWNKRFFPALDFWVSVGAISSEMSVVARNIPLVDQARKVMEWEKSGYLFGIGRTKSIFSSTAPPGASHHLSMLAFDVVEYHDPALTSILNNHGWFQTIVNDPPHFTYLGVGVTALPSRGLKNVSYDGYSYWVPNITPPSN